MGGEWHPQCRWCLTAGSTRRRWSPTSHADLQSRHPAKRRNVPWELGRTGGHWRDVAANRATGRPTPILLNLDMSPPSWTLLIWATSTGGRRAKAACGGRVDAAWQRSLTPLFVMMMNFGRLRWWRAARVATGMREVGHGIEGWTVRTTN